MRTARDISAIVFGVLEIAYFFAFLFFDYGNWTALFRVTLYLNVASWLAFIVLAAMVFDPFSYKWVRVMIAFIVFMTVPAVFSLAATKLLTTMSAAKLWFELTFVITTALKLGIAGCIYVWSVYRQHNAASAQRAN